MLTSRLITAARHQTWKKSPQRWGIYTLRHVWRRWAAARQPRHGRQSLHLQALTTIIMHGLSVVSFCGAYLSIMEDMLRYSFSRGMLLPSCSACWRSHGALPLLLSLECDVYVTLRVVRRRCLALICVGAGVWRPLLRVPGWQRSTTGTRPLPCLVAISVHTAVLSVLRAAPVRFKRGIAVGAGRCTLLDTRAHGVVHANNLKDQKCDSVR
jgi:hypothetical protein